MRGFPVPAATNEWERRYDRAADYWWWAEKFGWTPDQVDALPADLIDPLADVTQLVDEIRREDR